MSEYFSIRYDDGVVKMLDQRLLPEEVVYREYTQQRGSSCNP
jgi:methylthioribose-1-phosphate isomerase